MKIIQPPQASANHHKLVDATKLINEVYSEPETGFNDFCICAYEVLMDREKLTKVSVYYDKIMVKPKDSAVIYWPIQPHEEELNPEYAIQTIKKLASQL